MATEPDRPPIVRAAPRRKVFRLAWLDTAEGRHRAHVLNLSSLGACLHTRVPLRVWGTVTVQIDVHTVEARVSWVVGERCGVKFARELDPAELAGMIG